MKDLNYVNIKYIVVEAKAGSILSGCIKESLKLCLDEDICIKMVHNNRIYYYNPKQILDIASKQPKYSEQFGLENNEWGTKDD